MAARGAARGGTCSVQALSPLIETLAARGFDIESVLAAAGLERDQLEESDRRISAEANTAAWREALRVTDDPALGLHAAQSLNAGGINRVNDLFTYLARSSSTGREAFERTQGFVRLMHDDARIRIDVIGGHSVTCIDVGVSEDLERPITEYLVGLIARTAPAVVGDQPLEVWFAYAEPEHADEYRKVMELPCRFDAPATGLAGLVDTMDDPLPKADPGLAGLLDQQVRDLVARLPESDDLVHRVRAAIGALLPKGDAGIAAIAAELGTSERSLRRHLKEAGTTHRTLLDEVRSEVARGLLGEGRRSASEVAFMVGFSDASAFNKAFRRWTGMSPSEHVRRVEELGS